MGGKTSKKSAKVAKRAAAKRVAAKAAKPQAVAKSSARKPTKAAAKKPPAHYAVPKSDGAGAVQAWIDLLPDESRWPPRALLQRRHHVLDFRDS